MPTEPTEQTLLVNNIRLHLRDWGGEGPPLLLLHGLASSCHIWDLVAPQLRQVSRVIALDQRGHGESEKTEGGYDFASVTADLRAVVEALQLERPILVGHSWGGNVVVEYAA